jgi:hypothetical protein
MGGRGWLRFRKPLSVGYADCLSRKRARLKPTIAALTSPRLRGEVARRAGEGPSREPHIDTQVHSIGQPVPVWNQIEGACVKFAVNLFGSLLLIAALLAVVMYFSVERQTIRYRLTYEVQTPEGLKVGSSVIQVDYEDTSLVPIFHGAGHSDITGEAAVVDLGQGKYLFSLITRANDLPYLAFPQDLARFKKLPPLLRYLNETKPKTQLPFGVLPQLVTFADVNDPTSAREVNPNNLAASFGEGYELKSVGFEVMNDAPTYGAVNAALVWFSGYHGQHLRLNGETCTACPVSSQNLADLLYTSNFQIKGK